MQALALIMARGGSRRVPRKNVRMLRGLPLVAWPVRTALASGLFSRVIISTEDDEVAAAAMAQGAERPFVRPARLADDFCTAFEVQRHALQELAAKGPVPETVCVLYGTSCFISPELLRQGRDLLALPGTHVVFGAVVYEHPIERAWRVGDNGLAQRLQPEHALTRTQDLPKSYYDAGLCYWKYTRDILEPQPDMPEGRRMLVVPRQRAVDIDTEEDFALAEAVGAYLGLDPS